MAGGAACWSHAGCRPCGRSVYWCDSAATQIQEMTLSFIPKLLALVVVLFVVGPWMLRIIVTFSERLFTDIPGLVG